jgi:hypothetical protein
MNNDFDECNKLDTARTRIGTFYLGTGHSEEGASLLSIVIPCSDRPELETSLHANRNILTAHGRELIVVHAGGDVSSLKRILAGAGLFRASLVDVEGARFNKSLCLNVGLFSANGETAFLLDCDTIVTEQLMCAALNELTHKNFVLVEKARETDPAAHIQTLYSQVAGIDNLERRWLEECCTVTTLRFSNGKSATFDLWEGTEGRSLSGLIFLQKKHYVAIDGCNSECDGWGFEDYDLQIRLQVNLDLERRTIGTATHLTHPAPGDRFTINDKNTHRCFSRYRLGNFLGTYSQDVALWRSRVRKYIVRGERVQEDTAS